MLASLHELNYCPLVVVVVVENVLKSTFFYLPIEQLAPAEQVLLLTYPKCVIMASNIINSSFFCKTRYHLSRWFVKVSVCLFVWTTADKLASLLFSVLLLLLSFTTTSANRALICPLCHCGRLEFRLPVLFFPSFLLLQWWVSLCLSKWISRECCDACSCLMCKYFSSSWVTIVFD